MVKNNGKIFQNIYHITVKTLTLKNKQSKINFNQITKYNISFMCVH